MDVASVALPKHDELPGRSLVPQVRGVKVDERTLYFEHEGNRAVHEGRWKLVALRGEPWELYDVEQDRTELLDLSSQYTKVMEGLAKKFDTWADANHVTPFPDDYNVQYLKVTSKANGS